MSLSKEWWEYHLTSDGWVEGSYRHDFQGVVAVEKPKDAVLTIRFKDYRAHMYSDPSMTYDVKKLANNEEINSLKKKFGECPDMYKLCDSVFWKYNNLSVKSV
jgi:hypothetical protein